MEEEDENYLAILSDSANHCVTRKVCCTCDMFIYSITHYSDGGTF